MSLESHIRNVLTIYRPAKKWDCIYWMVDVHGVILPPSFHRKNEFRFLHPDAQKVLRWISEQPDHKLILWTSSYKEEIVELGDWLFQQGIVVDYVNCNPDEKNTEYADFSFKPYYNILLDDKSGMTPDDWTTIGTTLEQITGQKILDISIAFPHVVSCP